MNEPIDLKRDVAGLILAGGRARRLGGVDKALQPLAGRPLLAHVLDRARPQLGHLAISAHGDPSRFAAWGLPVLADPIPDFAGPLAGILAGMEWAQGLAPRPRWLVSLPCDTPFLPGDLVARLLAPCLAGSAEIACAASGGRSHPVVAVWPLTLLEELRRALSEEGLRKVDLWAGRYRLTEIAFEGTPDPFLNINRPEDLTLAAARLSAGA